MKNNIDISIIIVNYKSKEKLFACLASVLKSKTKLKFEIIVIDNDEKKIIEKDLRKKFKNAIYIKSKKNNGFGAGNNLGASMAKGGYLFFLNPDTLIFSDTLQKLYKSITGLKDAGIVAPLLFDQKQQVYALQGTKELTPLAGIFALSFLNRYFPDNPVSKKYWLKDWNKKNIQEVDVVPGTAFLIKRQVFEKIKGFDENFFLYFEESDLCRRVKKLNYKIFMDPKAKVIHYWGVSTSSLDTQKIIAKSRNFYFKKHFGISLAFLVNFFVNLNKTKLALLLILLISAFLRFYRLQALMMFIGDQGWFYLSARDLILKRQIPLVGITASHTWLHQGPLWTYLLAAVFFFLGFNPVNGAYFIATLGVVTVFLMYKVGEELFSSRIGLLSAMLYATSPLVVIHSRLSYHTSPIPFFVLLYVYALKKYLNGKISYFPLIIFYLSILYNFELATAALWFVLIFFICILIYEKRFKLSLNLAIKSFFVFLLPMLPIIIYDFSHGFKQTIKFTVWIFYQTAKFFVSLPRLGLNISGAQNISFFLSFFFRKLIFLPNSYFSLLLFIISIIYLLILIIKKRKVFDNYFLLFLFISIPFTGLFLTKTLSEAYLPMLFPQIILLIAIFFDRLLNIKKIKPLLIFLIFFIILSNIYSLFLQNYLMKKTYYGFTFLERLKIAKEIVNLAKNKRYNLIGKGAGSNFASFTMNYEYLTWYLGNGPSQKKENLVFTVEEKPEKIVLRQMNK